MLVARKAKIMLPRRADRRHDAEETTKTSELIARLVAENGVASIVIEHDMAFVRSLNADVTVLHLGEVIAEGPDGHSRAGRTGARGLSRRGVN